jgi:hypothetical protein
MLPLRLVAIPWCLCKDLVVAGAIMRPANGRNEMVTQPGLDGRHRDKNGEISRKHGNTLISTLRQTYGAGFAPGFDGRLKLSDVLHVLDEPSLSQLIRDLPPHLR